MTKETERVQNFITEGLIAIVQAGKCYPQEMIAVTTEHSQINITAAEEMEKMGYLTITELEKVYGRKAYGIKLTKEGYAMYQGIMECFEKDTERFKGLLERLDAKDV